MKYGSSIVPNSYAVTTKQVEVETNEGTLQQNEQAKAAEAVALKNGKEK